MIEQTKHGGKICQPSLFQKKLDLLFSETINVESLFSDKGLESSLYLSGTMPIGTQESDFISLFSEWRQTYGTERRRENISLCSRTSFRYRHYDLRYDLTRTNNVHTVPFPNVLFPEFIVIMKCRTTHGDS